jgi:hypothetical protein
VSRVLVERWLSGDEGETVLDVVFDEDSACYEVHAGGEALFRSGEFVGVLKWLLGVDPGDAA